MSEWVVLLHMACHAGLAPPELVQFTLYLFEQAGNLISTRNAKRAYPVLLNHLDAFGGFPDLADDGGSYTMASVSAKQLWGRVRTRDHQQCTRRNQCKGIESQDFAETACLLENGDLIFPDAQPHAAGLREFVQP